jgi:hypothetical protein
MSKDKTIKAPPRVGFGNFHEVEALMRRRCTLLPYATGQAAMAIGTAMLPQELRGAFEVPALAEIMQRDALRQVKEIDRALDALGFDISAENE